ncbi:MAG TPA: SAM-dependent methyltransferase, partial [Chloroflexi bacterium]|nr:SAM-dependent methyltransferase [Chloroflexota bacterium]
MDTPADAVGEAKARLKAQLRTLEEELNRLLARTYGVKVEREADYRRWLASHKPFHWFVEFYGVLQRGGFDAIVGNPPYLELSVLTDYQLRGYTCTTAGNLYAVIMERCSSIGVPFGRQGYIVPVSSVSTERYLPLQNLVESRELHYSSFDDRPSRLFDGLEHIRLTIHLLGAQVQEPKMYSTRYNKWSAVQRPDLFQILRYSSARRSFVNGSLPKLSAEIEHDIVRRLEQGGRPLRDSLLKNSDKFIYYSRKVGYFLQVTDFQPRVLDGQGRLRPPSEFKPLYFSSEREAQVALATLNSSLFFWFITVWSDCRHLNRREVEAFPLDVRYLSTTEIGDMLGVLSRQLMSDLQRNSLERTMRFAHDTLTVQWIIPKFSKPIIDEIDRVLARHYG